jgi:hypothetical protein
MAKTKGQKVIKNSCDVDLSSLKNDLHKFGYLLPTNDEELDEFEKMFGKTQIMFPEHLKRPAFLKKAQEKGRPKEVQSSQTVSVEKKAKVKKTEAKTASKGNDYFKKLVLAAEIANQLHEEPTFGHIKFVKLLYLCNQVCNMRLTVNFGKYAAGPLDGKLIRVVDAEFRKRKWFSVIKSDYGYRYKPAANIEDYKVYYSRYFKNQLSNIDSLIELFRDKKSDFCEIVATVYFLWNEFIEKHKLVNNASLIHDFYAWDDNKKRFKETEIVMAIEWMTVNGITPEQ